MVAAMMTDQESAFVEEMGQVLASYGMTPMAGRMWGWLLICDPPEQTAGGASRTRSTRAAARSAGRRGSSRAPGFIRRSTRRGDRREYFSAPPEALEQFLGSAGRIYRQLREIAERGLAAMDGRTPEDRARLQELHDVMAFVETEVPALVERFQRERAGTTGRKGATR